MLPCTVVVRKALIISFPSPADHTQPDDCNKHHYRTKKNKHQRHQERMQEEQNELRQKLRTQTVLHEVAEAAGTSALPEEFDVRDNPNSIVDTRGRTSDSVSDKRKKRKRRRRRRRRSKNKILKYKVYTAFASFFKLFLVGWLC